MSQPMFEEPVAKWDVLRVEFVSWCKWYNSIYTLPPGEKPSINVIDDNVALDEWARLREMEAERTHRELNKGSSGSSKKENLTFNMADFED